MDTIKNFISKYPPSTLILILFFLSSLFLIGFAFLNLESLKNLVKEDGPIENLQAILYLVGACLWISAYFFTQKVKKEGRRRRIFYVLFAAFFLFLFLEEISWGQRLFGFSTPEGLKVMNLQDETNIHNIGTQDTKLWIHILHAFLFATLGIIIPLLNLGSKRIGSIFKRIDFPIVHTDLIVCFGISLNFYYEPGLHWSVPLRTMSLLAPIIIVISGRFRWLLRQFKYPLFQISVLAVIGFLVIALNLIPETNQYIKNNMVWEIRELYIALSLFFFSAFEAYGAKNRKVTLRDKKIRVN
ncbi:MAG: hypothetical protein V3U20_09010 [Thermoplasmata archaeon]